MSKVNGFNFKWSKFQFYCDCGHGWLRVPYEAAYCLGILRKISDYSYAKGNHLYLEEDRDAALFYNACKSWGINITHKFHNSNGSSSIRSFNHFDGNKIRSFYFGEPYDTIEKQTEMMMNKMNMSLNDYKLT